MTITLAIPHTTLSPNGRGHWRTKAKHTKAHRNLAKIEAKRVLDGKEAPAFEAYSIHYYWPGTHRDDDNAIASVKAYLDGICDALKIDDKTLRFRALHHSPANKNPRVEIILHPAA